MKRAKVIKGIKAYQKQEHLDASQLARELRAPISEVETMLEKGEAEEGVLERAERLLEREKVEAGSNRGRILKDLRLSCDLSQEDLAEITEVHPKTPSFWERGAKEPGADKMFKAHRYFIKHFPNLSLDSMMEGDRDAVRKQLEPIQ